jgi:hypothetical protein
MNARTAGTVSRTRTKQSATKILYISAAIPGLAPRFRVMLRPFTSHLRDPTMQIRAATAGKISHAVESHPHLQMGLK